ncbi:hypothetical protein [Microbacterium sp. TPU 3598]|uniref:hypothetical protein n=1 Tax=Microbacterium sp. TPU 3598 TaxID=1938334 RepID=UPI000BBA82D4|nr:hypothetical protein [Microbacterium sp. TPU 3598]
MQRVELSGGRGWLDAPAAASVHRIDEQLGRLADVNDAGRSPEQADKNYAAWIAYLAGGPKAPYALPASKSVHCQGLAVDSDDWYNARAAAIWRENGWKQTARYPNNPKKDEPWHGEYFPAIDQHRNKPASSGANITPDPEEDITMKRLFQIDEKRDGRWFVVDYLAGTAVRQWNSFQLARCREDIDRGEAIELVGPQPLLAIEGLTIVNG